jgi:hypothetical protein
LSNLKKSYLIKSLGRDGYINLHINDPQRAQAWFRLTFRPLPSGYPPMNRLKRLLKCALRSYQMRCEKQEFIKPPRRVSNEKLAA